MLVRESYTGCSTHTMHSWPELGLTSMHQQQLMRDDTNSNNTHKLSVHLAGISLKTQELYVLVFCARYLDLLWNYYLLYPLPTTHYHYPLSTTHYPLSTTYYCRYLDLFWNYLSYYNVGMKLSNPDPPTLTLPQSQTTLTQTLTSN